MRTSLIGILVLAAETLTSCNQTARRSEPNARQAGRDAYRATQNLKKDAKEAARQLHEAEEQFREGWSEASRENQNAHQGEASRERRPPAPRKPGER